MSDELNLLLSEHIELKELYDDVVDGVYRDEEYREFILKIYHCFGFCDFFNRFLNKIEYGCKVNVRDFLDYLDSLYRIFLRRNHLFRAGEVTTYLHAIDECCSKLSEINGLFDVGAVFGGFADGVVRFETSAEEVIYGCHDSYEEGQQVAYSSIENTIKALKYSFDESLLREISITKKNSPNAVYNLFCRRLFNEHLMSFNQPYWADIAFLADCLIDSKPDGLDRIAAVRSAVRSGGCGS